MGQKQRSFGRDIDARVKKASAYVEGFRRHRIASVSKHFPGYDVLTNSDHEIAVSDAPRKVIEHNITAFAEVASSVDGVMMSSIQFSAVNGKPAVLSPAMAGWARQLHPDSVLMTDDLWGTALRSWIRDDQNKTTKDTQVLGLTRLAIDAGNDVLMITFPQKAVLMKKQIVSWMKKDSAFQDKVNAAVRRVLTIKQRIGLLN
jgi:beta-N-acetylhexosaminidase